MGTITQRTSGGAGSEGLEELNLLEWALGLLSRQAPTHLKTISARDVITDAQSNQKVERSILLSAPGALSLPTWQDQDILLALFKLTMERTRFTERELRFSLYEVLKSLHLSDSGPYCRRVSESLDRWSGLWIKFTNSWRRNDKWHSEAFSIIDRVKLNGGRGYDPDAQQVIYWDDVVVESIAAKHTKGLDWEFYLSLSPTAKRLYRFLDKRFNQRKVSSRSWTFDLVRFCHNKIGLSHNYGVNKCKEKLLPAVHELEQSGFLAPASSDERFCKQSKGVWLVDFRGARRPRQKEVRVAADLVEQLKARSVNPHKAASLAATFGRQVIEEKIRYYDSQRRGGRNIRPGFLVASIEQRYELPVSAGSTAGTVESSTSTATQRVTCPSNASTATRETAVNDRQQRARDEYWNLLPAEEQTQLETDAFRHADRLALDGWNRANATGLSRIAAEYRDAILNKHLDRLLAFSRKAS